VNYLVTVQSSAVTSVLASLSSANVGDLSTQLAATLVAAGLSPPLIASVQSITASAPSSSKLLTASGPELDIRDLAGYTLSWTWQGDISLIVGYRVYLATDASGAGRSQVGSDVPAGTYSITETASFNPSNFSQFVVYAKSSLAELSTPQSLSFDDTKARFRASSIAFWDLDLDLDQVAGNLTWTAPPIATFVVTYNVYLAHSDGSGRVLIGDVAAPNTLFAVPTNTTLYGRTHWLVYAVSSVAEQLTPAKYGPLFDAFATVSGVSFSDKDLDRAELGGTASWAEPAVYACLPHCILFYLPNYETACVPTLLPTYQPACDPAEGSIKYLTTPLPTYLDRVVSYNVYLTTDSEGAGRLNKGALAVGTNELAIPSEEPLVSYTHLAVYTESSLEEQTTPAVLALVDTVSSVSDVLFVDHDLDLGELGGWVTWLPPADIGQVTAYLAYLAEGQSGRSQLAAVAPNCADLQGCKGFLNQEFGIKNFTHVLVYSRSSLVEQTAPLNTSIYDANATVSGVSFDDWDLDVNQLEGTIFWSRLWMLTELHLTESMCQWGRQELGDLI
jgi:hypothetical protein